MAEKLTTTSRDNWSGGQAAILVVACFVIGTTGGWMIRRSRATATTGNVPAASTTVRPQQLPPLAAPAALSPQQIKAAVDAQAAPVVAQLKGDATDFGPLVNLGNTCYDAKQYPTAIEYYQKALKLQPADTSVRTDMATAIWFTGNADQAITEFQKVLAQDPNKANALFNLGIVKWRGKNDAAGAIALWQKLLATNPNFEQRAQVEDLIRQAKSAGKK